MKPEFKIFLLLIVTSMYVSNAVAQWSAVTVPTKNNLNDITVLDEPSGWIVGDKGTILFRSGGSWHIYPSITTENLNSICQLNATEAWAVGTNGIILKLKGTVWEKVESPTRRHLHKVCFSNTFTGYAVGDNGTFIIYQNGSWKKADLKTPWHFYAVTLIDSYPLLAGGRENLTVPFMTVNYNANYSFTNVYDPGYIEISDIASPGNDILWAVGKPGTILHKSGSIWQKVNIEGKIPALTSISFLGENNGITVGYGGTIMTYTESGWQIEESPVNVKLNGSYIIGNKYYAVGNNGTVLELTRKQVPDPDKVITTSRIVISSYPNPASDLLTISIPESINKGILSVLNSMGQVVISKELDEGQGGATDQIVTSGLSNGLYIVNIFTDGIITASGKFIVQH